MEKQRVIDRVTKVAHRHLPPNSRLLLYGSRARGEARKDSDWDLLILLDQPEESFQKEQQKSSGKR